MYRYMKEEHRAKNFYLWTLSEVLLKVRSKWKKVKHAFSNSWNNLELKEEEEGWGGGGEGEGGEDKEEIVIGVEKEKE